MRRSIDKIIKQHGDEVALQRLTEYGRSTGEAWLERHDEIRNLGKAEKDLHGATTGVRKLRDELKARHAQTHISKTVEAQVDDKKRKLDEVEEQIEQASEFFKRIKREE